MMGFVEGAMLALADIPLGVGFCIHLNPRTMALLPVTVYQR